MLKVITSQCALFRYSALFQNNIYNFGHIEISTFIDGATPHKRYKYIQRCLEDNEKNKKIHQLIPCTTMFEYYILCNTNTSTSPTICQSFYVLY